MKLKLASCLIPLTLCGFSESGLSADARLEEVTVTAQKRSERLSQVPLAIDVIDASTLKNSAIDNLGELEGLSPSMNFGRAGRKARGEITIRGVGDFSRNIGTDARVAVYIDDVPLGRSSAYDLSLLNIDRIEILKGPQGTLFGTNAIAGAINVITQQPSDKLTLSARAGAGNFGYQSYSLGADIPMSSSLRSRIDLGHQQSDGFIENILLNKTIQGVDTDTARLKLAYTPNKNFSLGISADWLEEESLSTNGLALASSNQDPFNGFSFSPDPREVAHDAEEFEQREVFGASINAQWALASGIRLESISAVRGSEFSDLSEEDYSPIPAVFSNFDEEFDQISQELRIISPNEGSWSYVVGMFFSAQDVTTVRSASQLNPANGNILSVVTPGELSNDTAALFGNVNIDISESLSVDLGLRLQNEEKHLVYSISDPTGRFTNGSLDEKESFGAVLPRLAINFTLGDNGLVYYSVAKGSKSGGWNADFVPTLDDLSFDQENATSFEIGFKHSLLDEKVRLSLAAFKSDFRDFQVFQFISRDSGETLIDITNAGEATSQGIELDLNYQATPALSITLKAASLQSRFDKFDNANEAGESFANNSLPYAPEFTAYAGVNYVREVSSETSLTFHIDYAYSDEYFTSPNNDERFRVDDYYHTNASLTINFSESWSIGVWGKNLSDETYLKYRDVSFAGVQRGYFSTPKSYGVALSANF